MIWHFQHFTPDLFAALALLGVLIAGWLAWVAHRDRAATPVGRLTTLEEVALTIRVYGDTFRLIQQAVFLVLAAHILTEPVAPRDWVLLVFMIGQHSLTIHSLLVLNRIRSKLPLATGIEPPSLAPLHRSLTALAVLTSAALLWAQRHHWQG